MLYVNGSKIFKPLTEEGLEPMTPEELYGYSPNQGLSRSEDLASEPSYSDFFRNPKVMSAFTEHLDLSDKLTRRAVMLMNEAEQNSVLTNLTSKLYDNIVARVDDIDYGDIPNSKGDITKIPNYEKLVECIGLLRNILKEYKQNTDPIDIISDSLNNIIDRKDLFTRAFKYNIELPIIMYNNMVLSIISSVSYMIATSIEFIKTPNKDSFQIVLDKVAYAKTKNNLLYNNLKKFNKSCANKDFDNAMEHVIHNRIKGVEEAAAIEILGNVSVSGAFSVAGGIGIVIGILFLLIPILREIVFFFYYARMRVSEFFDIQADLLQMNAYNVQNNPNLNNEEKTKIVGKQLKIVDLFRKISNKIAVNNKKAEVNTSKEISKENNKMKINDVSDSIPDSVSSSSSALF